MSSSDPTFAGPFTGRVFLGADAPGGTDTTTVQAIEGKKRLVWDTGMDREYQERVREKAAAAAREILAKAVQEADALRALAREEGLAEGLAQAQARTETELRNMAETVQAVCSAVADQGRVVWQARRQDFVALIRLAVEKTLGVELAERRQEILESLLAEALERLETQRQITVRVAPEDVKLVDRLLKIIQTDNPALHQWRIVPDASLGKGGVILETPEGKADNSLDGRFAGVEAILDQMTVVLAGPEGAAEDGDGT
jgi:flagellar assembly protein FliH